MRSGLIGGGKYQVWSLVWAISASELLKSRFYSQLDMGLNSAEGFVGVAQKLTRVPKPKCGDRARLAAVLDPMNDSCQSENSVKSA